MIVDSAVYEHGKRRAGNLALEEALEAGRATSDGFVWIGLHEPTAEEFAAVTWEFHLHPLAVEDAIHAHQRPKLEAYDETLFVVLKTARYVDAAEIVEIGEVMLFLGDGFVVTVRHGEGSALANLRHHLEADPEQLRRGPVAVLHAVADRVVDDYATVLAGLDIDIEEIEAQVFSDRRHNHAERIYQLKREVLEFRRAVIPLAGPLAELASGRARIARGDMEEYFRDVHDHLLRVTEHIDGLEALLTSALNANLAQVGVRQNEDMRKISAWVAILAVPTMIAGIYGMNFDHMPELGWEYGYPAALGLMAVLCSGLYVSFRRNGWL